MMTDPIADMLTRMRNAISAGITEIIMPYSQLKHAIAQILLREKLIEQVEIIAPLKELKIKGKKKLPQNQYKHIKMALGKPARMSFLKRVSKPSCRIYVKTDEIKAVCNGFGISIISTSKGLMTDKEARIKKLGGELICEIY